MWRQRFDDVLVSSAMVLLVPAVDRVVGQSDGWWNLSVDELLKRKQDAYIRRRRKDADIVERLEGARRDHLQAICALVEATKSLGGFAVDSDDDIKRSSQSK